MTIAQEFPEDVARLEKAGFPAIAQMMHHHKNCSELDRTLGYSGATKHWVRGKNKPPVVAERLAQMMIDSNPPPATTSPVKQADNLMMIAAPSEKMDKVRRVLEMLGCEVIE